MPGTEEKRCQAPNSGIIGNIHSYSPPLLFFGRPRGRSVDSRRSCLAVLAIHSTVEHMKNHSTRGISCWLRHARILPNLPTLVKFVPGTFFSLRRFPIILSYTIAIRLKFVKIGCNRHHRIADNSESVGDPAVTLHDSPVSVGGIGCPFVKPMPIQ